MTTSGSGHRTGAESRSSGRRCAGSRGAREAYSLLSVIFERPAPPPPRGGDQEAEGSCYNRVTAGPSSALKPPVVPTQAVTAEEPRGPER